MKDQNSKEVKKLQRSLHRISAQNSLLRGEIRGLKEALRIKKKHQKKSYTLQLDDDDDEYHGGAAFWSPKKVRRAQIHEAEKQHQRDEIELQKAQRKQLK